MMVARCLFISLLFEGAAAGTFLKKGDVRHRIASKRSNEVDLIVESFVHLDRGINETWMATSLQTLDGDGIQQSKNKTAMPTSLFAQLLLSYSNLTGSSIAFERDKGGAMKLGKQPPKKAPKLKSEKMKGSKQVKSKMVKGEKTRDNTKEAKKTATEPSLSPSPSVWLPSNAPSDTPSTLYGKFLLVSSIGHDFLRPQCSSQ